MCSARWRRGAERGSAGRPGARAFAGLGQARSGRCGRLQYCRHEIGLFITVLLMVAGLGDELPLPPPGTPVPG